MRVAHDNTRCLSRELPPQLLEPRRIGGGVPDDVLIVPVPQIVLDEAGVCALVGEGIVAGIAQHVGTNGHRQLGLLAVFVQGQVDGRAVREQPLHPPLHELSLRRMGQSV
jgi:hypothetical protein